MKEAATIATAIAPAIARNTRIGKSSLSRPSITTLVGGIAAGARRLREPGRRTHCRRGRYRLDEAPGKPDTPERLTRASAAEPRPRIDGGSDGARTRDLRRDRAAL